jgi:hypothetical protein
MKISIVWFVNQRQKTTYVTFYEWTLLSQVQIKKYIILLYIFIESKQNNNKKKQNKTKPNY